ncbi:MAG: hypothetical protein ACRYFZ_19655 [Janthinobacterium lividum]
MAKEELTLEEQIAKLNQQVTDLTSKSEEDKRTIESQKGKLDSQGKELAKATEARDKAQSKLDSQGRELTKAIEAREQALSAVGEKATRIRELEQEAEANEQTIQGYQQQLRAAEATGDGRTVVTHEQQLYRVVVPQFHFEGKVVKAADLSSDATLVGKLVTAGSGVLELVEG